MLNLNIQRNQPPLDSVGRRTQTLETIWVGIFVRQMHRARETKDLRATDSKLVKREIGEKENVDGFGGVARPLNETLQ